MPPPPSYIDITSVPFSQVVFQADFNAGTYGGEANAVWIRFPANGLSEVALGGFCDRGGNFIPQTQVYDSDGTTLLRAYINGDYGWYSIIDSTTDKYIKIVKTLGGASDFDFTIQFDTRVVNDTASLEDGDILINDDLGGPGYLTGVDGAFKTFLSPFSSGEYAAMLPGNISIWDGDAHAGDRFEIYDALAFITSVAITGEHIITASDTDFFFCKRTAPHNVYQVTDAGIVTLLGTLPSGAIKICGFGASRDGSILYWGRQSGDASIHRWDTASGTPLSDLYTIPGYDTVNDRFCKTVFNNGGEIIVLADDSVVYWWSDASAAANFIEQVDSSGTLINSFDQGTLSVNHLIWVKDSSSNVYVWYITDTGTDVAKFANFNILTGSIVNSFDIDLFIEGINTNLSDPVMFGPATSCNALRFVIPATTATLTVIKVTDPTGAFQTFDFTTTGGLSPSTFSLDDGEQQVYTDLAPGTYGVTETVPSHWSAEYAVSNGDPHTAIVLGAGDNVIVIVTNTRELTAAGGIYRIVENKRNDTLWVDVGTGETEVVKIPDPFYKTGYIGD